MSEITLKPLTFKPAYIDPRFEWPEWNIDGEAQSIVLTDREVIVLGIPLDGEESGKPEDDWHNCDFMGCGQCHVILRQPLQSKSNDQSGSLPESGNPVTLSD